MVCTGWCLLQKARVPEVEEHEIENLGWSADPGAFGPIEGC